MTIKQLINNLQDYEDDRIVVIRAEPQDTSVGNDIPVSCIESGWLCEKQFFLFGDVPEFYQQREKQLAVFIG